MGIRDLAFSLDSLRFLDVRGDHCPIWESPVLLRWAEINDKSSVGCSDDASTAAPHSIFAKSCDEDEVITAIAAPLAFDILICGREDGSIAAFSALTGLFIQEMASHTKHAAIMVLHLSRSGIILISVDRSGRIIARKLELLRGPRLVEHPFVMDRKAPDVIEQIFISGDDTRILVCMSQMDEMGDREPCDHRSDP